MANAMFTKGKEKVLSKLIDFSGGDTIKAALVSTDYVPSLTTQEFLSEIAAYVLGTSQDLGNKSITGGAFDAADATWKTVAAGKTIKCVVIYKDTGVPATSPLLVYIDSIDGFPLATNGGDVTIEWDNGEYKIFAL